MAAKAADNFGVLLGLEAFSSNLSLSDEGGWLMAKDYFGYVIDYRA